MIYLLIIPVLLLVAAQLIRRKAIRDALSEHREYLADRTVRRGAHMFHHDTSVEAAWQRANRKLRKLGLKVSKKTMRKYHGRI